MKITLPPNSLRGTEVNRALHCIDALAKIDVIDSINYNTLINEIVDEHLTKEQLLQRHAATLVAAASILTQLKDAYVQLHLLTTPQPVIHQNGE